MKKTLKLAILATASMLLVSSSAYAMPILSGSSSDGFTWTASDSDGRAATAKFYIEGDTFNILLSNDTNYMSQPNEVLAGLFFDLSGISIYDPRVFVAEGSVLTVADSDESRADGGDSMDDGILDGEYGYLEDINDINGGLGYYGIANTAFDPEDGYPHPDWDGFGDTIIDEGVAYPQINSPNGPSFGIVNGLDIGVSSISSYVNNSVLMTWTILDTPASAWSVEQVNFLYGTDYAAPVPEPATMLLFGTGLIGLAGIARRKNKR